MSTISPTKKQVDKLADILASSETVEDAAQAAMDYAFEIYEQRAKFMLVGRVSYSKGYVRPEDARSSTVAVGPYSTEGQALKAAESLCYSSATHEEAKVYVIPMHSGTPASWYTSRKTSSDRKGMSPWWQIENPEPYWASEDGADRCFRAHTDSTGLISLCDRVRNHDGSCESVPWKLLDEREGIA